jgi:hypothetical protein
MDIVTRSFIQKDLRETMDSYTAISRRYGVLPVEVADIEEDGLEAEWRVAVSNSEGEPLYLCSDAGQLKNINTGRCLKGFINDQCRVMVTITSEGKSSSRSLAHLIAQVFIPRDATKQYVIHLDGDGWNNSVQNLLWVSNEKLKPNPKLTTQDVVDIRYLYREGLPRIELVELYRVSLGCIASVVEGKTWRGIE